MAQLPSGNVDEIWIQFMKDYSRFKKDLPVTSDKIRNFIVGVDGDLDQLESDIVQGLPAGDTKDWLLANPEVGRDLMARIERKREEVL